MKEFDVIVEECVQRITVQGDSIDACLRLYPEHAAELAPILAAASRLNAVRKIAPPYSYKALGKAKVMAHARAHAPRQNVAWFRLNTRQFATAMTMVLVAVMASTTAFAQAALPGEPLYQWKLGSEDVWWIVAKDRVSVDLSLVDRRATELTRVSSDPEKEQQARDELHDVLTRLESEVDNGNGPQVQQALQAHQKKLLDAGMHDDKLDNLVHGKKK